MAKRNTQRELELAQQELERRGILSAPNPGATLAPGVSRPDPLSPLLPPQQKQAEKIKAAGAQEGRRLDFNRRTAAANEARGLVPGDAGFREGAISPADRRKAQIEHKRSVANMLRQRAVDRAPEGESRDRLQAMFDADLALQRQSTQPQPLSRKPRDSEMSSADIEGADLSGFADGQILTTTDGKHYRNDARGGEAVPMVWDPALEDFRIDVEAPEMTGSRMGDLIIQPLPATATPQQKQTHATLVESFNRVMADESLSASQRQTLVRGLLDRRDSMKFAPERPSERDHPAVQESGISGFEEVGRQPFTMPDGSTGQYKEDGTLDIIVPAPPDPREEEIKRDVEAAEKRANARQSALLKHYTSLLSAAEKPDLDGQPKTLTDADAQAIFDRAVKDIDRIFGESDKPAPEEPTPLAQQQAASVLAETESQLEELAKDYANRPKN